MCTVCILSVLPMVLLVSGVYVCACTAKEANIMGIDAYYSRALGAWRGV